MNIKHQTRQNYTPEYERYPEVKIILLIVLFLVVMPVLAVFN